MAVTIPSDEEILKEIKGQISVLSAPHNIAKYGKPDIKKLIAQRRQWHADKPKREAAAAQAAANSKKVAEQAEKQYRLELKKMGKPIIKQADLIAQYPTVKVLQQGTLTQRQLQNYAEILRALGTASQLYKEGKAIEQQYFVPGRKKLGELLSKAYELYLMVEASALKHEIYEQMAGILKEIFCVAVHKDTPNSTLLLKTVFPDMQSKTAHQYGRALDFARAYEVTPADYVAFIKEYGGYEKIRGAYAKVLAADAGKQLPLQKQAAAAATRTFMAARNPIANLQLTAKEGNQLRRYQSADGYCYLITRIDMHNYMDIISPIPVVDGWDGNLLRYLEQAANKHPDWQAEYERLYGLMLKRSITKTVEKTAKAEQRAKQRAKREAAQKKRDAVFKRKVERESKKTVKATVKK